MCSIEEAWAGQKFEGSPVVSQGDMRMSYMTLPTNAMDPNNEFSITQKHDPNSRYVSRGINSQLSRVPRVPVTHKSLSDDTSIAISSKMPADIPPYLGESPRPHYMQVYDQAGETQNIPMPASMRDNFNDFNTVFEVSDTVNNFMSQGKQVSNNNYLLKENNNDDRKIIEQKHNTNDLKEVKKLLMSVLARLDNIESQLHVGHKNPCDMTLYVLIGLLLAFLIYSVLSSISRK